MSEAIRLKASKVIRATPETEMMPYVEECYSDDENPLECEYYKEDIGITVGEQYSIEEALTEEDRKQKSLYICTMERRLFTNIFRTDAQTGDDTRTELELRKEYPSGMVGTDYYSVAILRSKIYFIGGYKVVERQTLNQVFVFDPASSTWDTAPSMNEERASPAVVTYKNKIYAFGFLNTPQFRDNKEIPPGHFSEFLDPDSSDKKWVYLPAHQLPKGLLYLGSSIQTHALNEPQGVLYCWFNSCAIYSYTFKTSVWFHVPTPGITFLSPPPIWYDPPRALWWSDSSVFLNNILFWHHLGTIYAYRFSDCKLLRLCTFKSIRTRHSIGSYPQSSYLVNVGNAKLCLVYARQRFPGHKLNQKAIWCHTFDVQFFRTSLPHVTALALVHQGCQSYPHPDSPCGFQCVFAMDREVGRESGRGPRDEDRAKGQEREQYCYDSRGEKDDGWQKPKQKNRRAKIHKDKQKKYVVYGTEHPTPETSDHNNRFRHLSKW